MQDGKTVMKDGQAVWEHLTLKVWDPQARKLLREIPNLPGPCSLLAVSGDGKRALGFSFFNRSFGLLLWDLETGREIGRPLSNEPVTAAALQVSQDGKTAAVAQHDKVIRLVNLDTGKEIRRLGPVAEDLRCLALSTDDRILLSGGGPHRKPKDGKTDDCAVRLWDVSSGRELAHIKLPHPVLAAALSPDKRRLVTSSQDKTLRLWDLK